jgi:nucleotide-binding universal stress UspA family protein
MSKDLLEGANVMTTTAARARILVATDLSDPADEALRQADTHARSVDGVLGVCHVLPSSGVHMLFPDRYSREAADEVTLDERGRTVLIDRVTTTTGRPPGSFEIFVERGTEYAEIVRLAESWRATLVVVGSHGRPGAEPVRLGGVATRVVRYSHCPVLVVRPAAHRGLVVCATDLSAPSLPAVEAAVVEARLRAAKLMVLHVVDQGVPLASVSASEGVTPLVLSPELLHDLRARARAEIGAVLSKLEAHAESTIVEGHAAPKILAFIEEHQPEVVVIGTRGRTGLARVVLGSVAEHVVRAARTSVLVVRLSPGGATTSAPRRES